MLVSVIIPCYNVAPYLDACLQSVVAQTHRPLEVWIVDNNSIDNTLAIARRWAARYPDWMRVLEEATPGAPAARNRGLAAATGAWVQFLDADDLLLPHKIARQVAAARGTAAGMIVSGCHYRLNGKWGIYRPDPGVPAPIGAIRGHLGQTISNLYRRNALRWREGLGAGQDLDFIYQYALAGPVRHTADLDCHKLDRPSGQISQQDPVVFLTTVFELRRTLVDQLRAHAPELADRYAHTLYAELWRMPLRLATTHPVAALRLYRRLGPPPPGWQPLPGDRIRPVVATLFRWLPARSFYLVIFGAHKIRLFVRS